MKSIGKLTVVVCLFASVWANCCDENTIKLRGNAEVLVKPDMATITTKVEGEGKTSADALNIANGKINQLIGFLERLSIPEKDYKTSSLNISPKTEYISGQSVVVAQTASQTLSIIIRDLTRDGSKIGSVVRTFSQIDGIQINGVTFDQSDHKLGKKEARKGAFKNAKAKAEEYASFGGVRLRKILSIKDQSPSIVVPSFLQAAAFEARNSGQVPVGDIKVSASVEVTWAIAP